MTINDIFTNPSKEKAKRWLEISKELLKLYGTDKQYEDDVKILKIKLKIVKEYLNETDTDTDVVNIDSLKCNNTYKLVFPNGVSSVVVLKEILTYPSSGMPNDYLFTWVSGYDGLCNKYHNIKGDADDFPFPERLLNTLKITKV